jgi:hypothetical protein
LLGVSPDEIPLFDAYNPTVHLDVTQEYVASPEFKRNTPDIQHAVLEYVAKLQDFAVQKAALQAGRQAQMQAAISRAVMTVTPPTPPGEPTDDGSSAPGGGSVSHAQLAPDSMPAGPRTPDTVSRTPQPPGNTAPQPG